MAKLNIIDLIFLRKFKKLKCSYFTFELSLVQFKIKMQSNIQKFEIYIKFCFLVQIILCSWFINLMISSLQCFINWYVHISSLFYIVSKQTIFTKKRAIKKLMFSSIGNHWLLYNSIFKKSSENYGELD